jgi:diaminopimelate epimerase
VTTKRSRVSDGHPRRFYKMSGSGNDFVVFDTRSETAPVVSAPEKLRALCARGTGVGADGVVFIEPSQSALFRMRYHNSDGTRAEMCGNAGLCCVRLAVELGLAKANEEIVFETDSGPVRGRLREGQAETDLPPVTEVLATTPGIAPQRGEIQIGFARAGVPHLVVAAKDASRADLEGRGAQLRAHPTLHDGANVNFVSRGSSPNAWRYRTFERGVEAETLACGTGAVATAILLTEWGEARGDIVLETKSGEQLTVRLRKIDGGWEPTLRGPARIVFEGQLREI